MPLVSIVMATYNGEKYLRQQLDSIITQTYRNLELIAVDDASSDGTLEILTEYAKLDTRIKIYSSERNLGVVATFEKALGQAKGEFIAFSDQDDIFHKSKIELLVKALNSKLDRDLVLSDLSLIDAQGKEIAPSLWRYQKLSPKEGKPFQRLINCNFATGCGMMFRRRLLKLALPFPEDIHMHDWWIAVVSTTSSASGICLVDDALTAYRQHGSNVLGAQRAELFTISTFFTRAKVAINMSSNKRYLIKSTNVARLDGYLCKEIWSKGEREIIEAIKALNEGYLSDKNSSFFRRLMKVSQRCRYATMTGRLLSCASVIFFTLWPSK